MITRIRPAHWAASRLVLLALSATFAATMVSSFVRGRLSGGGGPSRTRPGTSAPATPARPLSEYLAIARRNLYATPPANETAAPGATAAAATNVRLLGTGRRGGSAFAIVEDPATKKQSVVRVGEPLAGARVASIGWRRVVLDRAGREEVLLVAAPGQEAASGADAAHASPLPVATPVNASADDQVRKVGDDRWVVAQAEVDHSLENLNDVITQMRAVPNMDAGRTTGFKVFAIKPGSLFQRMGIENNDVVQRVNGIELNDPTRAMALLQELQGQTRLAVDVVRGGETRTLTYEIR